MNPTPDATGMTGGANTLACSRRMDTAPHDGAPDTPPDDEPEEGIDERLLRELAERVRSERLRSSLQRLASQRLRAIGRHTQPCFPNNEQMLSPGPILARDHGL